MRSSLEKGTLEMGTPNTLTRPTILLPYGYTAVPSTQELGTVGSSCFLVTHICKWAQSPVPVSWAVLLIHIVPRLGML